MSSPPHTPPGLPLHDLSFLVEQFEKNRTYWRSFNQYAIGLGEIIENSNLNITESQAFALDRETESFASRLQGANNSQEVRNLFRELFEASDCPFVAEGQKEMISQGNFKQFTSKLMRSRGQLNFDQLTIPSLRRSIHGALDGIDTHHGKVPENVVEELVTDFRDGFSKGDITDAAKMLFEKLDYQIEETSPDEEERVLQKMQILSNSMAAPFQGKSALALFDYIKKCQNKFLSGQPYPKRYYAKVISVCNSSGTGKTKTILQLRNLGACVVYINMRPDTDSENFPPRDDAIALLFESAMRECTEPESFEKCAIMIFRALFRKLRDEFERITQTHGPNVKKVVHAWNESYTKDLNTTNSLRTSFFSSVSEQYNKLCENTKTVSLKDCRGLLEMDHSTLLALPCFKDSQQFLIISLDHEVQGLTVSNSNYLPSHILGQVIKLFSTREVRNLSIWVIFASTNSRIAHFAAPAHMHSSQRIVVRGEQFFPPFNFLQLDIFAKRMEELDLFTVGSYDDVIRSGRPLWESVKDIYDNSEKMSNFAAVKLVGMGEKETPDAHLLAALSQRFSLQVVMGSRDAVTFLEHSIAGHMRYVLNTHDDHSWQFTRYPSEPVLSNAAAHILYGPERALSTAILALAAKIGDRIIDAGEYEELISRLLVLISRDVTTIRAYDMAPARTLRNLHPKNHSFEKFPLRTGTDYFDYLRPVAVVDVLDTLFGPGWTKDKNDKDQREEIKRDFANAFISASYWVSMTNNVGDRPAHMDAVNCLSTLYKTGVALQCIRDQPLIDKVIPIMFLNKQKDRCVGWSGVYIQDKNRRTENANALHDIDPSDHTIDLATNMPYIAICFDFGVPTSKTTASTRPTRSSTRIPARTEKNNGWIRIHAIGLDPEVFPVLKARLAFASSLISLRNICHHKEADNEVEQHILATARFATSGFRFLRGPDIPFEGDEDYQVMEMEDSDGDEVQSAEMAEESDTPPLVETSGTSGHESEDVAMEGSDEASGSQE